jgi:sulfite reductase (ferredoxin)
VNAWSNSLPAVLEAWSAGQLTDKEFRAARALHGLHQQRDGRWMLRLKAPGGRLRPVQLHSLAEAALDYCDGMPLHFTSRQAVELRNLTLPRAAAVAEVLQSSAWSSRGSGGDGVRNVTVPSAAGLEPGDPFDPFPWALGFARYFEGREEFEALPRKFKVAFTTPSEAAPAAWIHDLAFVAAYSPQGLPGFRVMVGGGLGAVPTVARELRTFLPAQDTLRLATAVARVWSKLGDRARRQTGRMKHLINSLGFGPFAVEVAAMLARQADPGDLIPGAYAPPRAIPSPAAIALGPMDADCALWMRSNTRPQAGGGAYALLRTRQGQVGAKDLLGLAELAEGWGLPELRISQRQQLLLPGLDAASLPSLYPRLRELGLATPWANSLADVSACPGPGVCNLGMADPRGLASQLALRLGSLPAAREAGLSLRVSGCGNSCCHHKAALLGLEGGARQSHGRWYPAFRVYAGGGGTGAQAIGRPVAQLPAARVGEALEGLLAAFSAERQGQESLADWIPRQGSRLESLLSPYSAPDPANPVHFMESGAAVPFSPYQRGPAQC